MQLHLQVNDRSMLCAALPVGENMCDFMQPPKIRCTAVFAVLICRTGLVKPCSWKEAARWLCCLKRHAVDGLPHPQENCIH